jgi:hypothetical protein
MQQPPLNLQYQLTATALLVNMQQQLSFNFGNIQQQQ